MATDESAAQDHSYDAIVVGTGISGGWAAKELTEKGLKTLVLDRGRMVRHGDYPTATKDPWELPYGGRITQETSAQAGRRAHRLCITPANQALVRRRTRESLRRGASRFDWIRGYHVGGRSIMWARQSYRCEPTGLRSEREGGRRRSTGRSRYDEIAPWYDHVESFAGISGTRRRTAAAARRQVPAADGSQLRRRSICKQTIATTSSSRKLIIGRAANLTAPLTHKEPAAWHLPVPQHVHSRLSVRRLLQQQLDARCRRRKRPAT